ncbi:hypothetical protein CA13_49400 [Planctomycetes bacterium CA13]|uniref:Uncharacterized protein n=1 Tax=Novipirellula herctigrandis TaxID=2527986 RepID=A0A5C5Z8A1_9BACT|nr:hypothetical protein CA13_49400 [Planctomycetes bacterium CA13]
MNDPVRNPYLNREAAASSPDQLRGFVRTNQIIWFALIQGTVLITAILGYMSFTSEPLAERPPDAMPAGLGDYVLPMVGVTFGVGAIVVSLVLTRMLRQTAINKFAACNESVQRPVDENVPLTHAVTQLLSASSAMSIVGMAIPEGAAVLNAVLMLIDGQPLIHLCVIIVCVAAIAVQFPTTQKKLDLIEAASR